MIQATDRTLAQLAQEAIDVQDACNLSGVAQGFARAMLDLGRFTRGTDERNRHPIAVLWADKIASLTGTDITRAYAACHALAAASEPHVVGLDAPTPENDPVGRFRGGPVTTRFVVHYDTNPSTPDRGYHYIHCKQCLEHLRAGAPNIPDGVSPAAWGRLSVAITTTGAIQVRCERHDINVAVMMPAIANEDQPS